MKSDTMFFQLLIKTNWQGNKIYQHPLDVKISGHWRAPELLPGHYRTACYSCCRVGKLLIYTSPFSTVSQPRNAHSSKYTYSAHCALQYFAISSKIQLAHTTLLKAATSNTALTLSNFKGINLFLKPGSRVYFVLSNTASNFCNTNPASVHCFLKQLGMLTKSCSAIQAVKQHLHPYFPRQQNHGGH